MALIVDISYLDVARPHRVVRIVEGRDYHGSGDEPEPAYVVELWSRGRKQKLVICYRPRPVQLEPDQHYCIEWEPQPFVERLAPGMHITMGMRAELHALAAAFPRVAGEKPVFRTRAWAR